MTANHTSAAATIAPITMSTYRKATWENTVPRRTIVTSRHTQTTATWTDIMPRIVTTRSAVSGRDPSSGSLPVASVHTIPACTNTVPAKTIASTARTAHTASFPSKGWARGGRQFRAWLRGGRAPVTGMRDERTGTRAGTGVRQVLAGHGKYQPSREVSGLGEAGRPAAGLGGQALAQGG